MTETDLRWQLRQLTREMEPSRDLWPAIAAAIEQQPVRRVPRRWLPTFAIAASLLLVGGLVWKMQVPVGASPDLDPSARIVASESRAITDEYQAALQQYEGATIAPQLRPSLGELDRSVVQIKRAIAADPQSVFLLQQLRKTYSRRLALTQRAVTS